MELWNVNSEDIKKYFDIPNINSTDKLYEEIQALPVSKMLKTMNEYKVDATFLPYIKYINYYISEDMSATELNKKIRLILNITNYSSVPNNINLKETKIVFPYIINNEDIYFMDSKVDLSDLGEEIENNETTETNLMKNLTSMYGNLIERTINNIYNKKEDKYRRKFKVIYNKETLKTYHFFLKSALTPIIRVSSNVELEIINNIIYLRGYHSKKQIDRTPISPLTLHTILKDTINKNNI